MAEQGLELCQSSIGKHAVWQQYNLGADGAVSPRWIV